jgi:hypothetical protein
MIDLPFDAIPTKANSHSRGLCCIPVQSLIRSPSLPSSTFSSYILALPKWEQELQCSIQLADDAFTLGTILTSSTTVAATDGSVVSSSGSFGWILATADGKKLAWNRGPVFGFRGSSYRAEGYGLLSILQFLFHIFQFTQIQSKPKLRIHSDSESLLTKLSSYLRYDTYFPNTEHHPRCRLGRASMHC